MGACWIGIFSALLARTSPAGSHFPVGAALISVATIHFGGVSLL